MLSNCYVMAQRSLAESKAYFATIPRGRGGTMVISSPVTITNRTLKTYKHPETSEVLPSEYGKPISIKSNGSAFLDYARARGYTEKLETLTPFEKEQQLRKITPVQLLVGGFHYGIYYPSILGSMVVTQKGIGITPEGKTIGMKPKDNIFQRGYQWLRRDVDTGIQTWLTKDITVRDIYKDVIGQAEPKTFTQEISGIIKWVVLGIVAIVVVKVIK